MNSLSTSKNHQIGKSVYNETYDFTIDTTVAKFVENTENESHSYTFAIHRTNNSENAIENIVFSYNIASDTYDASLVSYDFSASQREEFLQNGYVTTPYDIHYESITLDSTSILNKSSLPCIVTYQEFHQPQNSNNSYLYSTNGYVQNACEHENDDDPCNTYTVIEIYCPDGGSGGSDATDDHTPPTNTSNDTTNGGGGNTADTADDTDESDNVVTSIVSREENVKQSILDCINGVAQFNTVDATTIDPEIFGQNSLTLSTWIEINNYLQDTGCSEDAQEEIIEQLEDAYDEYQIINELEGKALCVFNKLKSSSNGFKNAIKKFDGDFPVAHLKFNADDLDDGTRGETSPPENYVITVTLNNDSSHSGYNYRPNLLIAKTIIHEVIHAEMFRKLLELSNDNGDINVATLNQMLTQSNYPGMLDYYTRFGLNGFQHQQMAAHYRETIGRVLQEVDTGIAVPDNQQPLQLYLDLAWEGLNHSNIIEWEELTTQEEKDRVDQVISTYINTYKNENCN